VATAAEPITTDTGRGVGLTQSYTYDLLHDPAANRLLFCGLEGKIRAVNLSTGLAVALTPRLGLGAVFSLCRTFDGLFLGTSLAPAFAERGTDASTVLHVFDYHRLLQPGQ